MSRKEYSEVEPTDAEITEMLDEWYPEPVKCCGMTFTQSYVLKHLDRVCFDTFGSDNMRWYKCDVCGTVYKSDNAEEEAIECCQNHCTECGKEIDSDPDLYEMCEKCKELEEGEED